MPRPNFKKVTFLCMQQLTNFPYIEEDFDALTNYELLSKVVEYLNKVIANENEQNESILELYNSFNNLKNYVDNYFENLDVQDEINNKLDEMLEDGQLEQIIEQFLQLTSLICFDTVAAMKASPNLTNGSYAKTLGYYTKNDGGSALYKIRTITNDDVVDEMFILEMTNDNTLIAELITTNVNIKQLGAIENDDITDIVEASLNKLGYANLTNGEFKANISITNDNYYQIIGNDTTLVPYNSELPVIEIYCTEIEKEKIIKNINIELTGTEKAIKVHKPSASRRDTYLPQRINIENIYVYVTDNFTGTAFNFEYISEINVNNINVKRERIQDDTRTGNGLQITSCINFNVINSSFGFLDKAIIIDTNNKSCEGITINNCEMLFNNDGITVTAPSSYSMLSIRIMNCMIDQVQSNGIILDGVSAPHIENNWIGVNVENATGIKLLSTSHENYGTIISNNTIWLANKLNSYNIYIKRSNTYNIRNTNIISNMIFNYNLKAIYLDDSNSINGLKINGNTFETTSSDTNNTPLSYNAVPLNCIITECINNGSPLRISDDIVIKNCVNIINNKTFTASDITTNTTTQNNSNNTLVLVITATASGSTGFISSYVGFRQADLSSKYTQAIGSGLQGVVYITVPPKGYYSIVSTSAITINSIYGYYQQ